MKNRILAISASLALTAAMSVQAGWAGFFSGDRAQAGVASSSNAPSRLFVLWDTFAGLPAYCFPLDAGWNGIGAVKWNPTARDNTFQTLVILYNENERMAVQQSEPFTKKGEFLSADRVRVYSDPLALAQEIAVAINSGIVLQGLGPFNVTGAAFAGEVPAGARQAAAFEKQMNPMLQQSVFPFAAQFSCAWNGTPCQAEYTAALVVSWMPQVRPGMAAAGFAYFHSQRLAIAPGGRLAEARAKGGSQLGKAFVNKIWKARADRFAMAIARGRQIGANEGWELMKESNESASRTQERVRQGWSEVIREVKTVQNPLDPSKTIERDMNFNHSWINASQDSLLLSDRNLDPNSSRALMEAGDWTPVD